MLCKTEWSWELRTWSHKMNLLDILSTSPHYFCRKRIKATLKIQILILGFKGLKGKRASLPVDVCTWWCSVPSGSYLSRISATAWCFSAPPQGLCLSLAAGNLPRSGASWNEHKDYSCYQGTGRPVRFKNTWEAGTYLGLRGLSINLCLWFPLPHFQSC